MQDVLFNLEPCIYQTKEILYNELDEFNEIVFMAKGTVGIGFEINKMPIYCIRYDNGCVIGAFGATFSQRSRFIYRTFS